MYEYIDRLVEERDYLGLVNEKNRVLDIIYDIQEKINQGLKKEYLLIEHEELLAYIKEAKLKVLSLIN